jgi:tetratricopeptide (TPR) repeat protein
VHLVTQLLAVEAGTGEDLLRARALSVLGDLHGWIADPEGYAAAAAEALAIYRRLGDECGIAEATSMVGWAHLQLGHLEAAQMSLSEAVDRYTALGQQGKAAATMPGLAVVAQFLGDLDTARRVLEAALVALRNVDDLFMVGLAEIMIGGIDERLGNHEAAERHLQAGLSTYLGIGNVMGASWALYVYADLALQHDEPERALRLVGASDRMRGDTELPALMTASVGDVGQRARERLPDDVADDVYRQGQVMSTEEAVAHVRGHRREDPADACD